MRKVRHEPAVGHERPWADDGKIGVQRAEGGHGEWPEKVTVPLAQLSAEHDDRDAGQALVDEVGDGDVRGYDRDAAADVEHADELERGGSGVDEHRVAVVHQPIAVRAMACFASTLTLIRWSCTETVSLL